MTVPLLETRGASISDDGVYRYKLWRVWDASMLPALFIMLNPSTADANQDDPTIRRCIDFAKRGGYGGLLVGNLFAYRATDPKEMRSALDPVGAGNDEALADLHEQAGITIAAWGVNGVHLSRDVEVLKTLPGPLHCLGQSKDGQPRHPLYLRKDATPYVIKFNL